jgi:hypothetical protein
MYVGQGNLRTNNPNTMKTKHKTLGGSNKTTVKILNQY